MGSVYRLNFIALALAFVVTGLCMFPDTALFQLRKKPLGGREIERFQYCGSDSDCMVVNNGCCDCANGGKDEAIAKSSAAEFRNLFDCRSTACTELAAVPPCGSGVVSCIQHRCRYFSQAEFDKSQANLDLDSELEPTEMK